MSKPFDVLTERVDALERDVSGGVKNVYIPVSRRVDKRGERATDRGGQETITVRFSGITARAPVSTVYTHTWSASYTTGGEAVSPALETLVPDFQGTVVSPFKTYFMYYDDDTDKMVAYDPAGEIAAATNMATAVGTTVVHVLGRMPTILDGWTASEDCDLVSASLRFSEAVARDGTNYWTVGVAIRKRGETYGRRIGSKIDTSKNGIGADKEFSLFGTDGLESLSGTDSVVLWASAATQATAPLGDVVMTLVVQRKVS